MARSPRPAGRPHRGSPVVGSRRLARPARRPLEPLRGTLGPRSSAPRDASSDGRGALAAPSRGAESAGSGAAERCGVSQPPVQNEVPRRPRGSSASGAAPYGNSYHQRLNSAGKIYWTLDSSDRIVAPTLHWPSSRLKRGKHAPVSGALDKHFGVLTDHAAAACVPLTPRQVLRGAEGLQSRIGSVVEQHPGRALTVRGVEGGLYADCFRPGHDRRTPDGIDRGQLGPGAWLSRLNQSAARGPR